MCVCFATHTYTRMISPVSSNWEKKGSVIYRYKKSNFQPKRDLDIHLTLLHDFVNKRCNFFFLNPLFILNMRHRQIPVYIASPASSMHFTVII